MVVGGKQTGKTSLLRLLLETADVSPVATADQRSALDRFLKNSVKTTSSIQSACVEICESRFDRILFSAIDTPGLDFQQGKELKLERQIAGIVRYIDTQYADTMSEESKVVRQSKGDQHVHLCIYMIDPTSILTASARRALSALPTKTRSVTTISPSNPPELIPDTSSGDDSDSSEEELTVSPAEIRVIRRLAERTNVLPVIARADSLTDEMLKAVKETVRKALSDADLGFGIFDQVSRAPSPKNSVQNLRSAATNGNGDANGNAAGEVSEEEEDRRARSVIKLRKPRPGKTSQTRSTRDLSQVAEDPRRPISPDANDPDSVANVRFSAHAVAKADLSSLMPFALIAPEPSIHRHSQTSAHLSSPSSAFDTSEDGHDASAERIPQTPVSVGSKGIPYVHGPPEDLKGVFVRKFRWGMIDVLEPTHCDFAALRTTVLSTHMKMLKIHTKEVLYEKYRTEKLLVRRATQRISEEQTQRLLTDLGL
jgi:septin family protein